MAEVTMICVDNSGALTRGNGGMGLIKAQAEAIELYISEEIKAHPENMVGFTTMGEVSVFCEPSRNLMVVMFAGSDLHMIMSSLENLTTVLRELNIVVDLVNFGFQDSPHAPPRKEAYNLQAFVAAVNVDGNSRYLYAPDGSPYSLAKNLLSSPIMPRVGDGSTALAATATATLSLLEETKPQQNKAFVPDYENDDPMKIERDFLYSKYGLLSSELVPLV